MSVTVLPGGENGLTATGILLAHRVVVSGESTVSADRTLLTPDTSKRITVVAFDLLGLATGADGMVQVTLKLGTTVVHIGALSSQLTTVFSFQSFKSWPQMRPFSGAPGEALKILLTPIGAVTGCTYSGSFDVVVA